jgi:hypothetical protein
MEMKNLPPGIPKKKVESIPFIDDIPSESIHLVPADYYRVENVPMQNGGSMLFHVQTKCWRLNPHWSPGEL